VLLAQFSDLSGFFSYILCAHRFFQLLSRGKYTITLFVKAPVGVTAAVAMAAAVVVEAADSLIYVHVHT